MPGPPSPLEPSHIMSSRNGVDTSAVADGGNSLYSRYSEEFTAPYILYNQFPGKYCSVVQRDGVHPCQMFSGTEKHNHRRFLLSSGTYTHAGLLPLSAVIELNPA